MWMKRGLSGDERWWVDWEDWENGSVHGKQNVEGGIISDLEAVDEEQIEARAVSSWQYVVLQAPQVLLDVALHLLKAEPVIQLVSG